MNTLFKIFLLAGSGSIVTLLFGALVTKIIAVTLGPEGLVLYSQVRQIGQWFILLGTINGASSIIRLIARSNEHDMAFKVFTLFTVTGISVLLSCVLLTFSKYWLDNVLLGGYHTISFTPMLIIILLGSLSTFVISIINGLGESKRVVQLQIISSSVALLLVYPLIKIFHYQFIYILLGSGFFFIIISGISVLKSRVIFGKAMLHFNKKLASEHLSLSSILLITGIFGASTQIYIRTLYIHAYGIGQTGLFDAAWTIGMMYIMVILSSFSIYIIPRLSKIEHAVDLNIFINKNFLTIIGSASIIIIIMMLLKEYIIIMLYSNQFIDAKNILNWMLFGDFAKVSSWIFGAVLLAKGDKKIFLSTEIIFNLLLIVMTTVLIESSFEAVGYSFIISNIVYLILVYILVSKKYEIVLDSKNKIFWIFGLIMVTLIGVISNGY